MTLIVGALNRHHAVMVSDRRLSFNGQVLEDESSKMATLVCRDARLALAFTGLARSGSFSTRQWLLEALANSAEPEYTAGAMMTRFVARANETFLAMPSRHRFLTVFLLGYTYDESGPRSVAGLVSNFESWEGPPLHLPRSDFAITWIREQRPPPPVVAAVHLAGAGAGVRDTARAAVHAMLLEGRPASALVGKIVDVVREAADSPLSLGTIGKQCLSVVVPSDMALPAASGYHSAVASYVEHGVSLVEARGGEHGVMIIDAPWQRGGLAGVPQVMAGPRLGRNHPCWCRSGKTYKRCHGA